MLAQKCTRDSTIEPIGPKFNCVFRECGLVLIKFLFISDDVAIDMAHC